MNVYTSTILLYRYILIAQLPVGIYFLSKSETGHFSPANNMAVQKQGPKNVPSLLLDDDENELLFSLLGKGCWVRTNLNPYSEMYSTNLEKEITHLFIKVSVMTCD